MKRLLLLVLCWTSLLVPLGAQEALFFSQRLMLHYNQWQNNQGSSEDTRGTYAFNLGLPVLTYRLGALALTGNADYDHPTGEGQGRATFGLDHYGARMTLFPYRPFHISLDYTRSQSPSVPGQDQAVGNTYGLGLNYRGRAVQDVEVTLQRGGLSEGQSRADWSLWQMVARQYMHSTQVTVEASRSHFGTSGSVQAWESDEIVATTNTMFTRAWALRSNLQIQRQGGSRSQTLDLSLVGTPGIWTTMSDISLEQTQGDLPGSRSQLASQSLALNRGRWFSFATGAFSSVQAQDGIGGTHQGTLLLGGAYRLGAGWQVSSDISQSSTSALAAGSGSQDTTPLRNLRTVHVGVSRGGDLPGIIRHALFFLSDQNFHQRIAEEYPPGYVPSELAAEMARRRFHQMGTLNFAGDLWHEQAGGDPQHSDWFRITGQVRVNSGLTGLIIGDWKTDNGLSLAGQRMDSREVTLNGSYSFGASQVLTSAGYGRTQQSPLPGDRASFADPVPLISTTAVASRYVSTGFNSRFWLIPYGFQWVRYDSTSQPSGRAFTGYFLLNFRQVNLRVSYQSTHRADGLRDTRLTVDLLRWMDTIAFGGGGF